MIIKYCSECGKKLEKVTVPAEYIIHYSAPVRRAYKPFSKYDEQTGKRQYAQYWKCPTKESLFKPSTWFHDEHMEDAILV